MCGRYARRSTKKVLADYFQVDPDAVPEFAPSYNVAPQTVQPVVRLNSDTGGREIALMRWGLIPSWARDVKIGYSTVNAKAETVATSPTFRDAFKSRRCLVPADAFYEWQKLDPKRKQPFAIALKSGQPYAFAGLWERWRDRETKTWLETFTIITTDPNAVVEPLHDRMPVIIEARDYERWLQPGDPERLPLDLLRPYPAEQLSAWKVDPAVGNVRNDSPGLCEPMADDSSTEDASGDSTGPTPGLFH